MFEHHHRYRYPVRGTGTDIRYVYTGISLFFHNIFGVAGVKRVSYVPAMAHTGSHCKWHANSRERRFFSGGA